MGGGGGGAGKDLRHGVLVVEDDGREVAVDAVVQVQHVRRLARRRVAHVAARDHVAGQRVGGRDIEAARLADDADRGREMRIDDVAQHGRHVLEQVAREAAANVQAAQLVPFVGGLVEDAARVLHGLEEAGRVRRARTDVKAHADDVEVQAACKS